MAGPGRCACNPASYAGLWWTGRQGHATTVVVLEFAGHPLALTEEEFEAARQRGLELIPPSPGGTGESGSEILDASGMEARTGVPASWWLESARRGTVPHLKLGKYIRFCLREALAAAKEKRRRGVNGQ